MIAASSSFQNDIKIIKYLSKFAIFPALDLYNTGGLNVPSKIICDLLCTLPSLAAYIFCFVMYFIDITSSNTASSKLLFNGFTAFSNFIYLIVVWISLIFSNWKMNDVIKRINGIQESFYFKPNTLRAKEKIIITVTVLICIFIFDYFVSTTVFDTFTVYEHVSLNFSYYFSWLHICIMAIYASILKKIYFEINESLMKSMKEDTKFFIQNKLAKLMDLHNITCEVASDMNTLFSGQIMAILTLNFLGIVLACNIFSKLLLKFRSGDDYQIMYTVSILVWILLMLLFVSIFTYSWDETSSEVN